MIIINSDDFGYTNDINKATYLAFQQNLITSTTALVNFDALEDAISYVKDGRIKQNAVGIHLNLTEGRPITLEMVNNEKFCQNGLFKGLEALPNIYLDRAASRCVYEELNAQIEYFIEKFGFVPSHIDSHQHIHTKLCIMLCIRRLAKKYGIKAIRLSRNIHVHNNHVKKFYKLIFNKILHFDGFLVTDNFGDMEEAIVRGIDSKKTYEIMVHAMLSTDGKVVLDMDRVPLHSKLRRLQQKNTVNMVNYKSLRRSVLLFGAFLTQPIEYVLNFV
jgi:hypothetical protein